MCMHNIKILTCVKLVFLTFIFYEFEDIFFQFQIEKKLHNLVGS